MPERGEVYPEEEGIEGGEVSERVDEEIARLNQQSSNLTRWQVSPVETINFMEHDLRGEIFNGKEWERRSIQLMNERGIRTVISIINSYVNKDTVMTTFSENQIMRRLRFLQIVLCSHLKARRKTYEIEKEDLDILVEKIMALIESIQFRALKGGEKKFLSGSERRIERRVEVPQTKRRKLIPFL